MQKQNIHWFPGHMKKALDEIKAKIKIIDLVIEILDARAPISSKNYLLENIIQNKKRILLLNKSDLVDEIKLQSYLNYLNENKIEYFLSSINSKDFYKEFLNKLKKYYDELNQKYINKNMKPQIIKVLICGIPNVGKSSLINLLARKNAAGVANLPGYTKGQKWIKVNNMFYFLDTPGILPSNYEDKNCVKNLAMIGTIKKDILPIEEIAQLVFDYLINNKKDDFINYYYFDKNIRDLHSFLNYLATKRGFLLKGNELDITRSINTLLDDFKNGKICKVFLDNYAKL